MNSAQLSEYSESIRVGNYLLGHNIGQGTFNKVKIARHILTNEEVAVKIINKNKIITQDDHNFLQKQIRILRKVRHPNIIQLLQIIENNNYIFIVTEYAVRGQLFTHIETHEKLTEFEASKFLQQLLDALEYIHQIGVTHRDIKPQNILLDYKYNLKLIDFGLSGVYSPGQLLQTACGSPSYAPPEMWKGLPYEGIKSDLWSVGIVLFTMCFGYLPFDETHHKIRYESIMDGSYQMAEHASDELQDILRLILQVDPEKRPSINEIRSHNFCKFSPGGRVWGIIIGLSDIPIEDNILIELKQLNIDCSRIFQIIRKNKHNSITATYYLILQRYLRTQNKSLLNYYISKNNLINRYQIIQKVRINYEKRKNLKIQNYEINYFKRNINYITDKKNKIIDEQQSNYLNANKLTLSNSCEKKNKIKERKKSKTKNRCNSNSNKLYYKK